MGQIGTIGTIRYDSDPVAAGKTKVLFPVIDGDSNVMVVNKEAITAGDGKKRDEIPHKDNWCATMTANAFGLFEQCGLPTAFLRELDPATFLAKRCCMIPYEVVVRRVADGSFLKRHPDVASGHSFPRLVFELFLKTSGRKWGDHSLPVDDPLVELRANGRYFSLWRPDVPISMQKEPILMLDAEDGGKWPLSDQPKVILHIERLARRGFLVLERAWQMVGATLHDIKFEFGYTREGELVFADVISPDEHRLVWHGQHLDKQPYRDGAELSDVARAYAAAARLSESFKTFNDLRQRIVFWRASLNDNIEPFTTAFRRFHERGRLDTESVTASAHKQPQQCLAHLTRLSHEVPDSIIIAIAGRSNGLGPMLAANTTLPVITVPASAEKFPEDVWSSLRAPSEAPVMTVLDPENAVRGALKILAMRNPGLYADLRAELEERLENTVPLA